MKKLLVLNFFPAFIPPISGGELRLVNMYRQLSQYFDISLVSWTYSHSREEIVEHGQHFREYRVPKSEDFDEAYDFLARAGFQGEMSGLTCAMVGRNQTRYHEIVAELLGTVDGIVHEFPYTVLYDSTMGRDGKPRFYNSHNFENEMIHSLISGDREHEIFEFIQNLERMLVRNCQIVLATSSIEMLKFHFFLNVPYNKLYIAPNGYDPEEFEFTDIYSKIGDRDQEPFILFFGSEHPPSIEGAKYIVQELALRLPRLRFVIAGRVGGAISQAPNNVQLLGEVSPADKRRLFATASVFINPIFSGAGTCLKAIEALAAGLPLVTTVMGARGLNLIDGVHALVAERDMLPDAILRVLQNDDLRQRLSQVKYDSLVTDMSWVVIVKNVATAFNVGLERPLERDGSDLPAPVLILNDYSVANPVAGGSKRLYNLLRETGQQRSVVLLCLHDKTIVEVEELAPKFVEVRIPKSNEQRSFQKMIDIGNWISINDIAASLFCLSNQTLIHYYKILSCNCGAKVFSHPYLAPLLEVPTQNLSVIYDSHNVEADMKLDILAQHTDGDILSSFVCNLENYLLRKSTAISCVTQIDAERFATYAYNKPMHVILNGCTILSENEAMQAIEDRSARHTRERFTAIFVGSGHPPNVEAAQFICREVLPCLPKMTLLMVGEVCNALEEFSHVSGIRRMGVVTEAQKHDLLLQADIALNPVVNGGGSNLKMADYFGYALPSVSTPEGIRGFAVRDNEHLIICPLGEFVAGINSLINNDALRKKMATIAYRFASQNLDWRKLGQSYAELLQAHTIQTANQHRSMRMLVVTYRYTEPSQGGAEEYLVRFLQKYAESFNVEIDLVAPVAQSIYNEFNFCCSYSTDSASSCQHIASFLRKLQLFPDDMISVGDKYNYSLMLWEQKLCEQIALGRQAMPHITDDCLLGGWYFLEIHDDGACARWTSGQAEIFTTVNTIGFRLFGWHDGKVDIDVYIDDVLRSTITAEENFNIEIALEPGVTHVISLHLPTRRVGSDTRSLGFLLHRIQLLHTGSSVWEDLELDRSFDLLWREQNSNDWINALYALAQQRPDEVENAFRAVRGPRSQALVDYVRQVAGQYDCVLVQGVPFSLSLDVAPAIKEAGVPLILLPHLHVDDDFYHWKQYYNLYKMADAVISFSTTVSDFFFKPIGVKTIELNGGGGDPIEFLCHRTTPTNAFKAIHNSDRPYFLVLGRKTGAKGYRTIIRAHQVLKQSMDIDLVLIGPDEDKLPINNKNVYYYGRQDRKVVLDALASCVAVVTMSSSESFGIVLVEAWMSHKPVIANRKCLSFRELVDEDVDGLLVSGTNELVGAMRELVEHPEKAIKMGLRGYAKAIRDLTWDNIAASFDKAVRGMFVNDKAS